MILPRPIPLVLVFTLILIPTRTTGIPVNRSYQQTKLQTHNVSRDYHTSTRIEERIKTFFEELIPRSTRQDEDKSFFEKLTLDWLSVVGTVFISFPWLVISVFDAIDAKYRPSSHVVFRLTLASGFLICAYTLGIFFVIGLLQQIKPNSEELPDEVGRYDEVGTILVLLFFNLWHVGRNIRGWTQFIAIRKVKIVFFTFQKRFAQTFPCEEININNDFPLPQFRINPSPLASLFQGQKPSGGPTLAVLNPRQPCVQGLLRLQISNRLVDNDLRGPTPFLSPFFKLKPVAKAAFPTIDEHSWSVAIWRAWWTQDTTNSGLEEPELTAPQSFLCDKAHRYQSVADLLESEPSALRNRLEVRHQGTNEIIKTKVQWADALLTYGAIEGQLPEGQQDTHGTALPSVASIYNSSGVALLIKEKTCFLPHRMSALWYSTARFEDLYDEQAFDLTMRSNYSEIIFPKWPGWLKIAKDISEDGLSQISATNRTVNLLAGELASTSLIIIKYPEKYQDLVNQIHNDGLNARWTFGWSGLLACFSHLWTKDRIYIAMLNGLSLLALNLNTNVVDIDPNVRAMLYGYAAFAVSDRAVGRRIAQDRRDELDRRYAENKGKTCRGSGLHATRLACRILGLPAEASHMDGICSFSTGWASEFLERKPGNQTPEHGKNHDEVEARQGSSNSLRYPYSHS